MVRFYKAGSTKMTKDSIVTAGIDTSKLKLDIAIHQRPERWQVPNTLPGWRELVTHLTKAGVTRVATASSADDRGNESPPVAKPAQ